MKINLNFKIKSTKKLKLESLDNCYECPSPAI